MPSVVVMLLALLRYNKFLLELFSKVLQASYAVSCCGYLPFWDIVRDVEANFRVVAVYCSEWRDAGDRVSAIIIGVFCCR